MLFLQRTPLLPLLLSILSGLFFAHTMVLAGVICASLFIAAVIWKRSALLGLLCLLIGITFYSVQQTEVQRVEEGQALLAEYSLAGLEIHSPAAEVRNVRTTRRGYSAEIITRTDTTKLHATEHSFPKNSRFLIYTQEPLSEGAVILLQGQVSTQETYGNFGEFDWTEFHRKKGIIGTLQVENLTQISTIKWRYQFAQKRNQLRETILSRLLHGIDPSSRATWVIPALVLGLDPPDEQLQSFRDAGVMHLFVVSGLHVGLVISIVWILLYFSPLSSLQILGCSLGIAWIYVLITGSEPPAVRAALIVSVFSLGIIFRQRVSIWNSLIAALIIILSFDRYALLNVGVLLSFGVVSSLILIVQAAVNYSTKWVNPDPFLPRELWNALQESRLRFARWGLGIVAVATVSWISSSIITGISFGRVYLFGIIASLLLFPAAFSMMIFSAFSLIIGSIHQPAAIPINKMNASLAGHAATFASWVERHPNSVWKTNSYGYRDTVTVFNLPQGAAAIYIDAGDGVLIDCGKEWIARSIIKPCLERSGQQIGQIFLSHDDSAHSTGLVEFPDAEIVPSYELPNSTHDLGKVQIQTYSFPSADSTSADNNIALFRIITPSQTIGYVSDAGYRTLHQLESRNHDFSCDILIVGEHSAGESTTEGFLKYSGAKKLVLGRTYNYSQPRQFNGVTSIDQRTEGAVQFHF